MAEAASWERGNGLVRQCPGLGTNDLELFHVGEVEFDRSVSTEDVDQHL